ncbi:uncharacterized protein ALTATR162_LOCUS10705 [Alternaria atra]|uniref:Uncharacterized protein n=1 Tax=Alternaria atra TaxID=119953 RepID=A0A8J2NAX7_9PLEO|nr:uncharacterized protein ALTATR162_LOCUS8040 [Alternaria atra]XP_043174278.1 uncharacterized protein ALTATR162_LOCUS10705 [Alternaria atra]CAG5175296.1 unnamed protein product [Alternaria atra]CAG5183689.1 unnamed protein product [Alternaria atra]
MAAPSRPYEIPPVLVHRNVPRMAATSIVVEGQDGKIEDTDSRRGATRLQQSDADMNGRWERPPPTNQPTGMEEESTSRSEQSSPSAIPTPANTQETTFQVLSAPSLSMDASSTILPELVESTARPSLAVQVDVSTMNGTSTIQTASTTVPAFLADSGVKINEEALPGMNQGDPSLVTVPGMNQEAPLLVTAPIRTPLATPESSLVISSTSAMTVDKPMPGKNQPKPTVDAAAASLTTLSDSRPTNVPTSSTPSSTTSTSISTIADVSTISFSMLPTLAISTLSSTESSTTTSSPVLSPVLTFVTITRTAQGKEDAQTSTQTVPAPLAVTAPQSLSSSFLTSSLVVGSAIPSSLATAVSVEPQSGLTPLARSLFILFGVLGFITILIALGILWVMRANKRRAQAARQQAIQTPVQETGEYDNYGNTIRISSNNSIKTFLTESEKAIVNRAATPDGGTDASAKPSSALTEAINSFITKSRRLTYKISP